MYEYSYSIANALRATDVSSASRQVAAKSLREIGLTVSVAPPTPGERLYVYAGTALGGPWGVDVPADRAEELARQVWKDSRTRRVQIGFEDFPKPSEPTEPTVESVQKEFEAFKKRVVQVARRTKAEEGWCDSGFKTAMEELGLPVSTSRCRLVIELDFAEWDLHEVDTDDFFSVKDAIDEGLYLADLLDNLKTVEPIKD